MASLVKDRVRRHRRAMVAAGMRPIQLWVPDTRRAGFGEECRRQSRMLYDDPQERELLDFIEAVTDIEGWE